MRNELWNVLQFHEDKMDNFALVMNDFREDFVFCIDE